MKKIQDVLVYKRKVEKYTAVKSSTGVRTSRCMCGEKYKRMVKRLRKKRVMFLDKWVVMPVLSEETAVNGFCSGEDNRGGGDMANALVKATQVADTVHRATRKEQETDELIREKTQASKKDSSQRSRPAKRKQKGNGTSCEKNDIGLEKVTLVEVNKEASKQLPSSMATSAARDRKKGKRPFKKKGEDGKIQEKKVEITEVVTRKRFKKGGKGEVALSRYLYQLLQSGCICPQVDLIVRLITGREDDTLRLVVSDERLSVLPGAWENLTEQGHSLPEVVQVVTMRATVPQIRSSSLLLLEKILRLEALSEKRVYVVVSAGCYDWSLSARTCEDEAKVVEDLVLFKSELERLGRESLPRREVVVVLCPLVEAAVGKGRDEGEEEKKGEKIKNQRKIRERRSNDMKEEEGRCPEGEEKGRIEDKRKPGAEESMKRRNIKMEREEKEARMEGRTSSALKRINRKLRKENASLEVPISTSSSRPWKHTMRDLRHALCGLDRPELQEDSSRNVCRILNGIFDALAASSGTVKEASIVEP
ncbi:uncharacterized protein [Penaeus vannamei]|uniref:uncharacterized protein n=1 Tax=Penaeus vannamei TaxID=6689 RepID=UPI00387F519A